MKVFGTFFMNAQTILKQVITRFINVLKFGSHSK